MRSSIACVRCRRSKVKCVNNGVGTTCRACENSKRDCTYPSPIVPGSRRRESVAVTRPDGTTADVEKKSRPRKSTQAHLPSPSVKPRDSPRPLLDALDPRLLTPAVWQELFDIFQIHYSADLPFLHPPTFLKPLRHAPAHIAEGSSSIRPPASIEFLLAFLALTARFHPKLIAHHSPATSTRPSNPLIAAEYYAAAANERMSTAWTDDRPHDIEWTQAALMLGLHEWGMCRGAKAWLVVGMAIRAAQAMGLQYEIDLDDEPLSCSIALSTEAEHLGIKNQSRDRKDGEADFIQQEVRRRTFWSCFIMDRYLSSGKYRPQMLHARELRIQLPASEQSFLFGDQVRTLMLGEEDKQVPSRNEVQSQREASVRLGTNGHAGLQNESSPFKNGADVVKPDEKGRLEISADEGLVSRYIKILELYGKVLKWSCAGGRRVEEHPPWDPRCEWYKLRQECFTFKAKLPRQHTLTPQNTQAHISLKTSTPYTLVHTVYLLCQTILNREYVPFLPLRCNQPEGPLDAPTFPSDKYNVPPGFWAESAKECFKSARDLMDLVRSCQEWNALVETPIIGFAIYTVAFTGVYCINFPWMDPDGYLCTPPYQQNNHSTALGQSKGIEAAKNALEMIGKMRPRLHMANGWFKTITRVHKYIQKIKKDYRKNIQAIESGSNNSESPSSTRHLSLREGGLGGGLDEYKLLERTLKDFGDLDDHDIDMADAETRTHRLDAMYTDENRSKTGTSVKSEEADQRAPSHEQPRTESGFWNAINSASGPISRTPSIAAASSGAFRSYDTTQTAHYNNFRPTESNGSSGPPTAATPGLTSPKSLSASTTAHTSPIFDHRPSTSHNGWASQSNTAYPMQPPQHNYINGIPHYQPPGPPQQSTPTQNMSAFQAPNYGMPPQEQQAPWDATQKEAWFNGLTTQLGGDDVAAFVDGGELADWAAMSASRGFGGGWLSTVWNGQGGNMG